MKAQENLIAVVRLKSAVEGPNNSNRVLQIDCVEDDVGEMFFEDAERRRQYKRWRRSLKTVGLELTYANKAGPSGSVWMTRQSSP